MGALLGDASVVDDDDQVGVVDGRQAVCDDHRGTSFEQVVQSILHEFFALGVEGRGGLVEDQNVGVFQHGACDREALSLASGEFRAAVSDVGVVAFGAFADEAVGIGDPGRFDNLLMRGAAASHADVVRDRIVEEHGVLGHDAHVGADALLGVVAQGDAVDEDFAARGVVEAGQEFAEGRFSASRGSDERDGLPAADFERDAVDHLARTVVGEVHVAEFDLVFQSGEFAGVGFVLDFGFGVDDREDALSGGQTLVDVGELIDEGPDGAGDLGEDGHEGDESSGVERSGRDERASEYEDDADSRDSEEFAHRGGQLLAAGHREGQPCEVGADVVVFLFDVVGCVVALDDLDSGEGFVERGDHFAHPFLVGAGGVSELLDDVSDEQRHDREEEDREEGEFPRDGDHHDDVSDDEERLAEGDLQRIGDAELDDADIGGDFRDDVALSLVGEVSDVHVHDAGEHLVSHFLERAGAHVLHGPGPEVAEEVAQQADDDGDDGQQQQNVLSVVFVEYVRIGVVEEGGQILLVELQGRKFFHILEGVTGVEHRVQDRDDQHERQRVEQRIEERVEEIGDRVFFDRTGEAQQPHVSLEHSVGFGGCAISQPARSPSGGIRIGSGFRRLRSGINFLQI